MIFEDLLTWLGRFFFIALDLYITVGCNFFCLRFAWRKITKTKPEAGRLWDEFCQKVKPWVSTSAAVLFFFGTVRIDYLIGKVLWYIHNGASFEQAMCLPV